MAGPTDRAGGLQMARTGRMWMEIAAILESDRTDRVIG
jgi:hypothetical protein